MKRTRLYILANLAVISVLVWLPIALAQQTAKPAPAVEVIKFTPEIDKVVKEIFEAYTATNKKRADRDCDAIGSELGRLQALFTVQLARFCAKHKPALDPDEYEYSADLTGIVKKRVEAKDAKP